MHENVERSILVIIHDIGKIKILEIVHIAINTYWMGVKISHRWPQNRQEGFVVEFSTRTENSQLVVTLYDIDIIEPRSLRDSFKISLRATGYEKKHRWPTSTTEQMTDDNLNDFFYGSKLILMNRFCYQVKPVQSQDIDDSPENDRCYRSTSESNVCLVLSFILRDMFRLSRCGAIFYSVVQPAYSGTWEFIRR